MEFLKKNLFAAMLVFIAFSVYSQDESVLINAFSESYTLEAKGEYKKAMDILKTVYSADSYELNLRLGWLNYQAGVFTESMSFYQKAVDLRPYAEEAKFGIIYPASALGKWDLVISYYKKILEVSPNNTVANYKLGLIYYGKKEFVNAEACFKKNVDLYPFTYDSLLMLAWTYYQTGKLREAKVLFNKVLLLSPADTSAKEGLSLIK